MGDLTFNQENHEYRYRGKLFPSVTQCLEPLYNFGAVTEGIMERAAQYGTNVHEAIRLYLSGTLDWNTLDDNLKPVVSEFTEWFYCKFSLDQSTDCGRYNGTPLCCWRLAYCGTPDIIIDKTLIEIKTRRIDHHVDDLQLYAYEHLLQFNYRVKTEYEKILIELIPGQPLRSYPVKNKQAWGAFRKLLDHWWHNHAMQQWVERWKRV